MDDLGPCDQGVLLRVLRREVPHDLRMIFSARQAPVDPAGRDVRIDPSLFFRIFRYPIPIPPLRSRREDIPDLARAMLADADPTGRMVLEPETLQALGRYRFPGNLIELRSTLIWATLLADGDSILPSHLPSRAR